MPKTSNEKTKWHFLSAEGKILGDLATEVSRILLGKNSASFTPGVLSDAKVVVTNAAKVAVSGTKESNKLYHRHSNFPGGLRTETLSEVRAKNPKKIIENAVWGMLPTNRLRERMMANLYIYPSAEHPHHAQEGNK